MARRIARLLLIVAVILAVPLIAMRFTDEVTWTAFDFIVAGALLLATGLIFELGIRSIQNRARRLACAALLAAAFLLVWAQLAVGIV